MTADDPWLEYADDPDLPARLFCLPYAGGGPKVFRGWSGAADGFAVAAVRLPGRDRRLHEPVPARIADLMPPLAAALEPHLDRPYALFGHSAGARIAFELVRRLRRSGHRAPLVLFVSGARPPHRLRHTTLHDVPDAALAEWLISLGGMPRTLLDDAELCAAMLSLLRADLRLITDPYVPEPPLSCPVRVFTGSEDPEAPAAVAAEWRRHTTAAFGLRTFPGGHFFLRRHHRDILADVAEHLTAALGTRAARTRRPLTHRTGG